MKKRFGNVAFTGTLSQGLYPLGQESDLLSYSPSYEFLFDVGPILQDTTGTSVPELLSGSLVVVRRYLDETLPATSFTSTSVPELLSGSLVVVRRYLSETLPDDTTQTSVPELISGSLTQVVYVHELYDNLLGRPEDTLSHTISTEFTFS